MTRALAILHRAGKKSDFIACESLHYPGTYETRQRFKGTRGVSYLLRDTFNNPKAALESLQAATGKNDLLQVTKAYQRLIKTESQTHA